MSVFPPGGVGGPPGGGAPGSPSGAATVLGPFLQSLLKGFMQGHAMDPGSPQGQGFQQGLKLAQLMRKGKATGAQPPTAGPGGGAQSMSAPGPMPPGGAPGGMPPGQPPGGPPSAPGGIQPLPTPPPGFPPAPPGSTYVLVPPTGPSSPPMIALLSRDGQMRPLGPVPGWRPPI